LDKKIKATEEGSKEELKVEDHSEKEEQLMEMCKETLDALNKTKNILKNSPAFDQDLK